MPLFEQLICPKCRMHGLRLSTTAPRSDELLPAYGYAVCDRCRSLYPIADHILDLEPGDLHVPLTLAGRANEAPLAPQIYENVWRPRALTLMTGKHFPESREMELVSAWAQVKPGDLVVDAGTSVGLYARGLARTNGDAATILAIDLAWGMLQAAHRATLREGLRHIAYLRAPAQALPFPVASVDVVVCGGSLNEFRSIGEALREMGRALKPDGRLVTMSLLAAQSAVGRLTQGLLGLSGIKFPTLNTFDTTIGEAGLVVERQETFGGVAFSLLRRASE